MSRNRPSDVKQAPSISYLRNAPVAPSATFSFTVCLKHQNTIGAFARIAQTIGKFGSDLCAGDIR